MRLNIPIAAIIAVLFFGSATAYADAVVLFEHTGEQSNYFCSACTDGWRVWDRFSLASDAAITQISAVVHPSGGPLEGANSIEFSIWDSTRTNQLFAQTFLWSELSPTIFPDVSANVFTLFADTSLSLTAGNYFLSVYDSAAMDGIGWAARRPTVDGFSFQSRNGDGTGELGGGTNKDMIFAILGTPVPEPSSLLLLGIGLAGVFAVKVRSAS